jgi:hypothetical protein
VEYHAVWWCLFHESKWVNTLNLAELRMFSLPALYGTHERVFSQVSTIKLNKRTSRHQQTLVNCHQLQNHAPIRKVMGRLILEVVYKEQHGTNKPWLALIFKKEGIT